MILDASAGVQALLSEGGLDTLRDHDLAAPPLFWSETTSVLHELLWRKAVSQRLAGIAMERLDTAPIARRQPRDLRARAWAIAERLGWAKTYDAEYVALAEALGCPILTTDVRLARSAERLVSVMTPADL